MKFKKARLLIATGAVVATMAFAGAAAASPAEHNSQPVTKSKAAYTHNHASHMSSSPMYKYQDNHKSHNGYGYGQHYNGQNHK